MCERACGEHSRSYLGFGNAVVVYESTEPGFADRGLATRCGQCEVREVLLCRWRRGNLSDASALL